MKRTIRLTIGILTTGCFILFAMLTLVVGGMVLEGAYPWKGVPIIMLSLYFMLIAHASIITTRIQDLLEEKKEREDTGEAH